MKNRAALALTGIAALALTGCTDSENTTTTVTETTTAQATAQAATQTPAETTQAQDPAPATGEDPVFAAIDAVLAAHAGGIITDIDREDGRVAYDIDVVVGDQVIELEVDADGTVREEERESDPEDVAEAHAATVTAAEAIRQALEQIPDGVLDEAELDEEDGVLRWEIELDDANGIDLAELNIPAT
ncbi:MAG: PepSY domain-containing protein [Corynebacterium sp.]|nr:PepSY domain-containing protein [Corynebacterium sp.]MDO5669485.1 PepSY domain-containing protein [Corynebacterium sp.]